MNQTDSDTITNDLQKLLADIKDYEEAFRGLLKKEGYSDWGRGYDMGAQNAFRTSHELISEFMHKLL